MGGRVEVIYASLESSKPCHEMIMQNSAIIMLRKTRVLNDSLNSFIIKVEIPKSC